MNAVIRNLEITSVDEIDPCFDEDPFCACCSRKGSPEKCRSANILRQVCEKKIPLPICMSVRRYRRH